MPHHRWISTSRRTRQRLSVDGAWVTLFSLASIEMVRGSLRLQRISTIPSHLTHLSSDLADGGSAHFASTIRKIKQKAPNILVEALTGDFQGKRADVEMVARSGLDVYAHNVETVEALTPFVRDRRANFRQSLKVLEWAKEAGVKVTKTSIMLGVGENEEQLMDALKGEWRDLF